MDNLKDIRWKQRFENFNKSYNLLDKYSKQQVTSQLEKAGMIQFFEMTFELACKVLKDYLEAGGYVVDSPRKAIKQAFQIGLMSKHKLPVYVTTSRDVTITGSYCLLLIV